SPVRKYTGLEASLGKAQFQGVDALKLISTNLVFKQNKSSVVNGAVLNWTASELASANVNLGPTDPVFQIGGTVGLSVADVVYASATINVTRNLVSGVDDPDDAGTKGLK